jgi:MFS family permease
MTQPPASPPPAPTTDDAQDASYLRRWLRLRRGAWLYLLHAALLTGSLAMTFLVFNLAIVALDLPPLVVFGLEIPFLGVLGSFSIAVAAVVALPMLWLVNRVGFWWALVANALLQSTSMTIAALAPSPVPLLLSAGLTGIGGTLFQISSVPFMTQLSNDATRDHLFSANFAVNIGIGGLGTFVAGHLAVWYAQVLSVSEGNPLAYRAVFASSAVGLLLSLVPLLIVGKQRAPFEPPDNEQDGPPVPPALPQRPDSRWSALVRRITLLERVAEPWYSLLLHPWPVLRFMIAPFLTSCGAALLIPYLNLFFSRRFDISDDWLGAIFTGLGLTAGVAALIAPVISMRIGKMRTIVLVQTLSLPFLLLLGFVPLLWVAVGAALLRQGLFNMSSPLYDAFAMGQTPEALRPTVIGAINGAFASTYLVMPLVSTTVIEHYGFAPLFVATTIFYMLATLANYLLFVRRRSPMRQPGQH